METKELERNGFKRHSSIIRYDKNFETLYLNEKGEKRFLTEMYDEILCPYHFDGNGNIKIKPKRVIIGDYPVRYTL